MRERQTDSEQLPPHTVAVSIHTEECRSVPSAPPGLSCSTTGPRLGNHSACCRGWSSSWLQFLQHSCVYVAVNKWTVRP